MTNNTNTTVKTSTLCKALINNAKFTDSTHFINKTSIGETTFKKWLECLKDVSNKSFLYYEAIAENRENIETFEKAVYTSIKNLLALVGKVPTIDGKAETTVNSSILFYDAIRLAIKDDAKIEVKALMDAREAKKKAQKEYRENCLTSDGIVKNGLTESYINSFAKPITEAQTKIDTLLKKANASVFGTTEQKPTVFNKKFEIALRKAILNQYHWTVKEANKAKEEAKQTRKANRAPKAKAKTEAKAKATENK